LKTTERFRRADFGHMEMQVTIEDAQNYLEQNDVEADLQVRLGAAFTRWQASLSHARV
jgi:hypothetical protein